MLPLSMQAQSSMNDEQVMRIVIREHQAGKSQTQIVTKLMQSGVDISQIRRVKERYQKLIKKNGMEGQVNAGMGEAESRMRTNNGSADRQNGKSKRDSQYNEYDEQEDKTYTISENFVPYTSTRRTDMQDGDSLLFGVEQQIQQRKTKVFGRDIFNKKNLTFEPNMNIATPQNYRLGPGDAVIIDIYGASQKTINATVSPEGEVTIEGYGPVQVSGLTVAQANARLRSSMGTRYSSSKVKLTVGQTKTIMVNVMGEVKAPGTYTLSAFASVFHAMYMAGGTNNLGTLRNIKVYRNNRLVTVVDIYDYILNGKLTGNVRLADNDVIVVGPYDCLVNITGKVKRPMFYEMKKNESMSSLLKYSGGFTGDAYTKAVRVFRKTGRERAVFNVEEFDMGTFHIADGDSVCVDSILDRYENTVEIKGSVFRPGLYQLGGSINSVRTLISSAEGLKEDAFTARAVLHRMKADRTLKVISVDVEGIMSGKVADIPLQQNDVLFIPTRNDIAIQRTITISGEVKNPGTYQYADNETLEDFVLQAGGLLDAASTVKVDVARRIVNPKATINDSILSETYSFALKDGFVVDGTQGFVLAPFDQVYVRRSPGFSLPKNVRVEGEIMFAGSYALAKQGERLSDIVKMAGGVTNLAYTRGARLERQISHDELLRMQNIMRLIESQNSSKDTLDIAKIDLGDTYYVGIELDKALANPGGEADIVLREGDRLIIPEYNGTVRVSGNVMYPNTVAYQKGKRTAWYINQAGGWGHRAKKNHTFIIYQNGTVSRVGHDAPIRPGCEIVVPTKPKRTSTISEWLTIGTSIASIATMIASIANLVK
uniref:SLBB domain-containing protein n=1 Tax=Prevotella sp. GTC17254 TaxID=3236794 RepID=A0AB33IS52_9BACT